MNKQIENLLFIIEIVQFKRYIQENEEECSSILGEYLSIPQHADLPHFENRVDEEEIMKSLSIVSRVTLATGRKPKTKMDVYLYGLYIVNKYIRFDSSHEINIPGRIRRKIVKRTGDEQRIRQLSMEELQVAFDEAFVEILALLQDPLSRFASWEQFNTYLRAIGPTAYPFFPRCKDLRRSCGCPCCNAKDGQQSENVIKLLDDNGYHE